MNKAKIYETLLNKKVITENQIKEIESESNSNLSLKDVLIKKGIITEEQYLSLFGDTVSIPEVDLMTQLIDTEVLTLLPENLSRKYNCMPFFLSDGVLSIAMSDPNNIYIIDAIKQTTKCDLNIFYVPELDIQRAIDQYYGTKGTLQDIISSINESKFKSGEEADMSPVINIVDLLIVQALKERASDIHIEPERTYCRIRLRVDGILYTPYVVPKFLQPPLISRIKVMAELDIAEQRVPQDGRIQTKAGNKEIDIRVSTQPTLYGENVVMRILDKSNIAKIELEDLGFSPPTLEVLQHKIINKPHGIFIVTGPTGSGKTTTLYSCLKRLNKDSVNIMTMEDPVEYQFELLRQTQVNIQVGLTFASGLRAILRQDPNIILVGEIRDLETAEIAIQSALTGHYVFSTLHTNDAASSFTRLIDMGVEPFLISSCVIAVMAQRLVRTICPKCKEEFKYTDAILSKLKIPESKRDKKLVLYRGKGCKNCNNLGYKGRIGIYETLIVSPAIQELVVQKVSALEIKRTALKEGMLTLYDDGLEKVLQGTTTIEELFRVTMAEVV